MDERAVRVRKGADDAEVLGCYAAAGVHARDDPLHVQHRAGSIAGDDEEDVGLTVSVVVDAVGLEPDGEVAAVIVGAAGAAHLAAPSAFRQASHVTLFQLLVTRSKRRPVTGSGSASLRASRPPHALSGESTRGP